MTTVLLVDNDPQTLRTLWIALTARGCQVVVADSATVLRDAAQAGPDAVMLDPGLPSLDGTEMIAGRRGWTTMPIIVLSGRTSTEDTVRALDAGADDYVTKPFNLPEVLARLRAALRRAVATTPDQPETRIVYTGRSPSIWRSRRYGVTAPRSG